MDASDQHFDCLCRACMNEFVEVSSYDGQTKSQLQWLSIFDIVEEECGAFRISELLTNAVPQMEVQLSDELPKKICYECLQQLLSICRFQQMCLQSEQQMRQLVSKKQTNLSIPTAATEGEIGANGADAYPLTLTDVKPSTSHQNVKHSSKQEPLLETREQVVKPEKVVANEGDIDQLQEDCRDSHGNLSEIIKNEPIGDDEHSIEYCDGEATHSAISVKDEVFSIEIEEQQINETNVKAHRIMRSADNTYECPYCPRTFNLMSTVLRHKEIHEGVKREDCDICGKSISKQVIKQHKLLHGNEKAHKCDFCEMSFAKASYLRCHMRKHTGEKPYKCKYCERPFAQSGPYMRHMRLHLGDNVHRCELCPLAFPAPSELREHFTTHKNEDPETRERNMKALKEVEAKLQLKLSKKCPDAKFNMLEHEAIDEGSNREACDICGKSFSKRRLKKHKLNHRDGKVHKCDYCEQSFDGVFSLRRHIRVHTGEKPYKCKHCERSFAQSYNLLNHMRRLHLGENVYRCELCPLAFPVASELRNHLTTHTNEDAETRERNMKALKEAEAELEIKAKEYVKAHSIIQGENKPYECHYCPQRFSNYANMLQHKEIHKDQRVKQEACDICGKIVRKSSLKQHKITHGGEKPHKCHLCEKSFSKMSNLRDHIRIHTGEKPYQCKYCQRSFSQSSDCMKHMRVHLGENVYRCELCPKAFPLASVLRIHVTTHKNEDPETREQNLKALKEAEAKLQLKLSKK